MELWRCSRLQWNVWKKLCGTQLDCTFMILSAKDFCIRSPQTWSIKSILHASLRWGRWPNWALLPQNEHFSCTQCERGTRFSYPSLAQLVLESVIRWFGTQHISTFSSKDEDWECTCLHLTHFTVPLAYSSHVPTYVLPSCSLVTPYISSIALHSPWQPRSGWNCPHHRAGPDGHIPSSCLGHSADRRNRWREVEEGSKSMYVRVVRSNTPDKLKEKKGTF